MNAGRIALPRRRPRRRAAPSLRGRTAGSVAGLFQRLTPRVWLALLAGAALLIGGWMWLRESSLASVEDVTVSGLTSKDAPAIRRALTDAAGDMTTLHVRMDTLRTAVAPFPMVKDLRVDASWPHALEIHVIEYRPVAVLVVDGRRIPVAGDGTLLRGELASSELPSVALAFPPAGSRVQDPRARAAVAVLAAAPPALRSLVARVRRGPEGIRVHLVNGPQLIFGSPARAAAKWAAAARVLADPSSKGATYVDLRVPERAVAGRFPVQPGAAAPAPAPAPAAQPVATGQPVAAGAVAATP